MVRPRPLLVLMEWLLALSARRQRRGGFDRGGYGEAFASLFLRRNGFRVVAMDWRYEFLPGDVDLVAWEGETLCFLEIKTREDNAAFPGDMSVDQDKQKVVRRLAEAYVQSLPWHGNERRQVDTRFDVVVIYLRGSLRPDVQLQRGAF